MQLCLNLRIIATMAGSGGRVPAPLRCAVSHNGPLADWTPRYNGGKYLQSSIVAPHSAVYCPPAGISQPRPANIDTGPPRQAEEDGDSAL